MTGWMVRPRVRLTHRATGLMAQVNVTSSWPRRTSAPAEALALARRVLRGKLWHRRRHGLGPEPLVRSYDLTGEGREAALAMLEGELPSPARRGW